MRFPELDGAGRAVPTVVTRAGGEEAGAWRAGAVGSVQRDPRADARAGGGCRHECLGEVEVAASLPFRGVA